MATQYPPRKPRAQQPQQQGAEQQVVEAIFKGIAWLVMLPFKGLRGSVKRAPSMSDAQRLQIATHWEESVTAKRYDEASWPIVVSEADKLVDQTLIALQIPGMTMGERMKAAQPRFQEATYNQLWEAHRLRNKLAHEIDVKLLRADVDFAVHAFHRALFELGVRI
jgi:hypothetical protein